MAKAKKHKPKVPAPLFCVLRKANQGCGCPENNNYVKANQPPATWKKTVYSQTVTDKETGKKTDRAIVSQAHHIVCCSSAQKLLSAAEEVKRIVEDTQWCVNKKPNIKPMPLWGNTLKYYCTISSVQWLLKEIPSEGPPFKNIPQHDSDHPRYTTEVNKDIGKIEKALRKLEKRCTLTTEKIASRLDKLTVKWKKRLTSRGRRSGGGTHQAWKAGRTNAKWYLPFSMTAAGLATIRTFPLAGSEDKLEKKLAKMMQAVKRWGF